MPARISLDTFFDPADIENAAAFATTRQDAHVAPSTKFKYNHIETEYKAIMERCPWRHGVEDVILARPDLKDLKYYIRILCIVAQKSGVTIRTRTLQSKVWTVLALVLTLLSRLLMSRRLNESRDIAATRPFAVMSRMFVPFSSSRSN
jgi:phosphate uptake regulator